MQEACGDAYMRRAAVRMGEAWPASCGKACGKPEIACQSPREEGNLDSYSARAIWSVIQFVCSDRTQCIIEKAIVFLAISYFEHIFIIIYSYISLYTILYILFTYFYNYILFMFRIFCLIFTTIEISLFVFTIYSFSKIFVATKI